MKTFLRYCVTLSIALLPVAALAQIPADVVLVHGKVWTENPGQPEAEAVAILGNHVVAVGTSVDMLKLAGPATKVIELGGKRVVPGFNDSHVHFVSGGTSLASVQLGDTKSEAEFRQRIADFAKTQPRAHGCSKANGTMRGGLLRGCRRIKRSTMLRRTILSLSLVSMATRRWPMRWP